MSENVLSNVKETLENWDKYLFRYLPKQNKIEPKNVIPVGIDVHRLHRFFDEVCKDKPEVTTRVRGKLDNEAYLVSLKANEFDEDGTPKEVLGLIELLKENTMQREIFEALGSNFNSVYYIDVDEDKVYAYKVADAVRALIGDELESIPGYENVMASYVHKTVLADDQPIMLFESSVSNLRRQFMTKGTYEHDYRILRDGEIKYFRAKFVNTDGIGELHHMVAGFADISPEKQRELERIAYVDKVTGGNNYESFRKKLKDLNKTGYLVSMDIHAFKVINSICGVAKGDETLRGIWESLTNCIGAYDIAGHVNADRFVIFCCDESSNAVVRKINKIEAFLRVMSPRLGVPMVVPYFGITKWSPEKKVEESYSEANFAKNQIKDRKDISYQIYSREDTLKMLDDKEMEDAFPENLRQRKFEVWYQPKYDPNTEELVGAEGLVRWRKNDGSLVPPSRFIPLFERDGLIKILDEYVFREVCCQQLLWKAAGYKIVPISINLSRASLYFESVVGQYHSIADEIGIDTKYVPIEITESAAIDNENIKALADRFHNSGFPLFVDDFGSGYSSLSTLNMQCFDTLKIDKSLIDYIGDFSGERLLEHTIALAKELGLYVTAEGVEKKEQVAFLKQVGCDDIQGFYYSKPLPKNEFERLL